MKNELAVYVEPETLGEEGSPIEMKLYAELAALKSTPEEIDKPADERLMSSVNKAKPRLLCNLYHKHRQLP